METESKQITDLIIGADPEPSLDLLNEPNLAEEGEIISDEESHTKADAENQLKPDSVDAELPENKPLTEPSTDNLTAEDVRKLFPSPDEFASLDPNQRIIHVRRFNKLPLKHKSFLNQRLKNQFARFKWKWRQRGKPLSDLFDPTDAPAASTAINEILDFPLPSELHGLSEDHERRIAEKYMNLSPENRTQLLSPSHSKALNKIVMKVGFSFVEQTLDKLNAQRVEIERMFTVEQQKTYSRLIKEGLSHRQAQIKILGQTYVQSIELMNILLDKANGNGIGEWKDIEFLRGITTQLFPSPETYFYWERKLQQSLAMKFDKLDKNQASFLTKKQRQMLISTLSDLRRDSAASVRPNPLLTGATFLLNADQPRALSSNVMPACNGWVGELYSWLPPVTGSLPLKRNCSYSDEHVLKKAKMESTDQNVTPETYPKKLPLLEPSKEPTPPAKLSSAESFNVYIVPSKYPKEILTEEQMDIIESSLLEAILEIDNDATTLSFDGCTRNKGRYQIIVSDHFSKEWLLRYFTTHQLLPHVSLKIVVAAVPEIRATALLPLCNEDDDKILKFISKQNKGLNVDEWNLVERRDCSESTTLFVKVDVESANILRHCERINFKLGKAEIRIEDEAESSAENKRVPSGSSSSSVKSSHSTEGFKVPGCSKPKDSWFADRSASGPIGSFPRYTEQSKSGSSVFGIDPMRQDSRSKSSCSIARDQSLCAPSTSESILPGPLAFSIFPSAESRSYSFNRSQINPRPPLLPTPVRRPMPSSRVSESSESSRFNEHRH